MPAEEEVGSVRTSIVFDHCKSYEEGGLGVLGYNTGTINATEQIIWKCGSGSGERGRVRRRYRTTVDVYGTMMRDIKNEFHSLEREVLGDFIVIIFLQVVSTSSSLET